MLLWIIGFLVAWGALMHLMALGEESSCKEAPADYVTMQMADERWAEHRRDIQLLLPIVSSGLDYRTRYQPD